MTSRGETVYVTPVLKHDGLAAWLIDDHLVVAEIAPRQLRVYNPSAAALWLLLLEGSRDRGSLISALAELFAQAEAAVEKDVSPLLAEWQGSGWLSTDALGKLQFLMPRSAERPDAPASAVPTRKGLPAHQIHLDKTYRLDKAEFRLRVGKSVTAAGTTGIAERVIAMLQGFPVATGPTTRGTATLDIVDTHDALYLRQNDSTLTVWDDQAEAMGQIIVAIFGIAYPHECILSTFHAAGMGRDRSVLLSATSGAGKSTLAAYLAGRGWRYYGDDIVGLSAEGALLPLPTAVGLKEGSWPVIRALHTGVDALGNIAYGNKIARYLPMPDNGPDDARHRCLCAWIFPHYQAGAQTQFDPISTIAALNALIGNGMALYTGIDIAGISALLGLLTGLPKYTLTYSSLEEAEDRVTKAAASLT